MLAECSGDIIRLPSLLAIASVSGPRGHVLTIRLVIWKLLSACATHAAGNMWQGQSQPKNEPKHSRAKAAESCPTPTAA